MIGWPNLPYELIGRATVVVLALVALAVIALVAFIVAYAIWWRGLGKLTNLMWRGYDIHGEHPPRWRQEVSIYASALQRRDFSNVDYVREQLSKREGRDCNVDSATEGEPRD